MFVKKEKRIDVTRTPLLGLVQNDTVVLLLEPLHGLLASHLVRVTNSAALSLSLRHTTTGTRQLHIEIHTEDTRVRVVLDTQINVLLNTETEVARVGEVLLHQLVLLHLQTALQNLQSLLATDGRVDRDLLVTTNREGTNGETGYRISYQQNESLTLSIHRLLTRNLLQHTSSLGDGISRLSDANVDHQLLNTDVTHDISLLALQ